MTSRTLAVAVCCSSDCLSSLSSRVFSIAIDGLGGKVRDKLDLLVGKWTNFLAGQGERHPTVRSLLAVERTEPSVHLQARRLQLLPDRALWHDPALPQRPRRERQVSSPSCGREKISDWEGSMNGGVPRRSWQEIMRRN